MAAQFFSSLADNALLVAAIALLMQVDAPSWLTPYLKFFFVISYVLLAPYVGAFADRLPKGQVMFLANSVKIVGCVLMLWGVDPLAAYAVVGLGVRYLWRDKLGQISLAVTTLFWGAGATLQFIVIEWARSALNFDLSKAAILQGVTAVGIAIGAVLASAWISLDRAVRVIPLGIAMGVVVIAMIFVKQVWLAVGLMILIGALAGFFVVPMNALLQHRGHHLVGAGRSIAVQNFNENTSILIMIALYSLLLNVGHSIYLV